MGETVEVDRLYLGALETLAAHVFCENVPQSDYKNARRVVANRMGDDAPYALEGP